MRFFYRSRQIKFDQQKLIPGTRGMLWRYFLSYAIITALLPVSGILVASASTPGHPGASAGSPVKVIAAAVPANDDFTGDNTRLWDSSMSPGAAWNGIIGEITHSDNVPGLPERPTVSGAALANLTISNVTLSPAFTAATLAYTAAVKNTITSVIVTPTLADPNATVTVNGVTVASGKASAPVAINIGANTVTILVTAKGGALSVAYTVTITRAQSSNDNLAGITISQGTLSPAFNSDSTNYSASVRIAKKDHVIYTIGDSITVGGWSDDLAFLLRNTFNFVNFAISGEPASEMIQRFPPVISAAPDYAIVLIGVDDITANSTAVVIENYLQTLYTSLHNKGSKVIALTLTPYKGDISWSPARQVVQDAVNAWIPTAANTDYLVDAYKALVDPSNPQTLLAQYDSGDHLHPNNAGGNVIANLIYSAVKFVPNTIVDQTNAANASVTVTPVASDANASVMVNGTPVVSGAPSPAVPIVMGLNNIYASVTAPDGTTKTYGLKITGAPSSNANLANFYLKCGAAGRRARPFFNPDSINYRSNVGHDTSAVLIRASTVDNTAKMTINGIPVVSNGISPSIPIAVGQNTITVVVTAQDGVTTKTYTMTVSRPLSNNALLSTLSINPSTAKTVVPGPGFINYAASVVNAVSSVTITPLSQDSTATITVNGAPVKSNAASGAIPLNVGQNTITTLVTAQDGVTTKSYIITISRAPASSNAALSAISITPYTAKTMVPGPGYANYTASVINAINSVNITALAVDSTATIMINGMPAKSGILSGPVSLNVGQNVITIVVTAQDGITTRSYILTITRAASANALLSRISTNPYLVKTAVPGPGYLNYTAAVATTVTSVTITAVTADSTAAITVNGVTLKSGAVSGAIPLAFGQNIITIVVTAQDGVTTKSYIITITRAPASTNALLTAISTNPNTVETQAPGPGYVNYTTSVPNAVASVTITAVTADSTATIAVNGVAVKSGTASPPIALSVGPNTITTVATAQDGVTTKSYIITIFRTPLSTDAALTAIAISPYTVKIPVSGPGYANFTASVINTITSVTITATAEDPTATIKVNGATVKSGVASGSIPLVVGPNIITTIVTAQDGVTTRSYIITITRAPSNNALLNAISMSPYAVKTIVPGPGYKNFAATVANTVASVSITPVAKDSTATIMVNGMATKSGAASAAIPLTIGQNTITTLVTAQDGITTKSYIITVTRTPSNDAILNAIAINPYAAKTVVSGPGYANYMATVANTVSSVKVTAVTRDATATVKVNGMPVTSGQPSPDVALKEGQNSITILVTAQDGSTTKSYIITLTRAASAAGNIYEPGIAEKPVIGDDVVIVHQAVSPNGDGINDFLNIEGISNYPDNKLKIMNHNGTMVYEADGYDNSSKTFDGHSNKTGAMQLPGTYFYSLDYTVNGKPKHKTGFIVLKY